MQSSETFRKQSSLAQYCRTGNTSLLSNIQCNENVIHYRRLVRNIIDDMLQACYPLTYKLLKEAEWSDMVYEFMNNHRCQSSQVWYMPKELRDYLFSTNTFLKIKYPFLEDLLTFEWIEFEMFMMEDKVTSINITSQTGKILMLNPEYHMFRISYPLHRKDARAINEEDRGNYYLIAHRNQEGSILFTETSPAIIRMIEYLAMKPATLNQLIKSLEKEFNMRVSPEDKKQIEKFFSDAHYQHLIIKP